MTKAGTAIWLLCLPALLGALAACDRQAPQANDGQAEQASAKPRRDPEIMQLMEATRQNPSLTDPKKAGAPLKLDPYPKTAGMDHHGMDMHDQPKAKEPR